MIRLHSEVIHYLTEDTLTEYANVKLVSVNREVIKMNLLVFSATKSPLFQCIHEEDEEHFIITEFTKQELSHVVEYCHNGVVCDNDLNPLVLKAFGLLKTEEDCNRRPSVKIEIKEEIDEFKLEPPTTDEEDDEDDVLWTPDSPPAKAVNGNKRRKVKEHPLIPGKKKTRERNPLNEEELARFETYEPPEPLETYRAPPQTLKLKDDPERDADKIFKCDKCDRKCSTMQNLNGHVIKYHSEHYNCPKCFKSFDLDDTQAFKLHLFKHDFVLTPRINMCIHCGKVVKFHKQLKRHLKDVGPYHNDECVQCPFKFTTYEEYKDHVHQEHLGKWKYRCGHCREVFDNVTDLKRHYKHVHLGKPLPQERKKIKPKKKVCEECGVAVFGLTSHLESVHGNAQVPCPHCGKVFRSGMNLKGHINKVHNKVPCTMCGDMISKGKVTFHIQQKHTPASERKHKCEYCGKGFCELSRLKDHINVHTGEKPHKCKFCNTGFASFGTKAAHERSHMGLKRKK